MSHACGNVDAQAGPGESVLAALGEASETPERLWNADMSLTTAEEVSTLAASARAAQVLDPTWCLRLVLLQTVPWVL